MGHGKEEPCITRRIISGKKNPATFVDMSVIMQGRPAPQGDHLQSLIEEIKEARRTIPPSRHFHKVVSYSRGGMR